METIEKALLHRGPYHYANLLNIPQIDDETRKIVQAFAYGSIADLDESMLKKLPEKAANNLRQISIVHLVSLHGRVLPYDVLLPYLKINSDSDLEKVVLEGIYVGRYDATIEPTARIVRVSTWTAREANTERVSEMEAILGQWMESSQQILNSAETKANEEDAKCADEKGRKDRVEKQMEEAKKSVEDDMRSRSTKGLLMGRDEMNEKNNASHLGGGRRAFGGLKNLRGKFSKQ